MKRELIHRRAGASGGAGRAWASLFLFALLQLGPLGCTTDEGTPAPNVPPETEITGSVPAEGGSVVHHVELFYRGGDVDGAVRSFDYVVETYPESVDTYAEIVVQEPAADDPRWVRTPLAMAALVLPADVLRGDPQQGRFERWHTFFVRAVDNEGATDETPDRRTFKTFNIGPQVWLTTPVVAGTPADLPRIFVMNWEGLDDIGDGTIQDPAAVRWVLLPAQLDASGAPIGFPDTLATLADEDWNGWFAWSAVDSTGREAVLDSVLVQFPGDSIFVFALQARDDGLAVTPLFQDSPEENNNFAVLRVHAGQPLGPTLPVSETQAMLGSWTFTGQGSAVVSAAGADTLTMAWGPMQTSGYGTNPGEYRYGWNIADPSDDSQWPSWGHARVAAPHVLTRDPEVFHVQARDDLEIVTTAEIFFLRTR